MAKTDTKDQLFKDAVEAIDAGDIPALSDLLARYPMLAGERASKPDDGYFKRPYLLWFVADNPIRIPKLPGHILEITRLLIDAVKRQSAKTLQEQLDYALTLVATGRIPKECGVQIAMMDLLIDAGAAPDNGLGALANGNPEAAEHLLKRGGELTLITAVCLDKTGDAVNLLKYATMSERVTALNAAAFCNKPDMITFLINFGVDLDAYPEKSSGFHTHATALHQAVASMSMESAKLLIDAGASLNLRDKIYDGTPLDWALHLQNSDETSHAEKQKYHAIAKYLKEAGAR